MATASEVKGEINSISINFMHNGQKLILSKFYFQIMKQQWVVNCNLYAHGKISIA